MCKIDVASPSTKHDIESARALISVSHSEAGLRSEAIIDYAQSTTRELFGPGH